MEDSSDKKIDVLIVHAIQTNERLDKIDENLSEHLRRSKAAEVRLDFIENEIKPLLENFKGFKWALSTLIAITAVIKFLEITKILN